MAAYVLNLGLQLGAGRISIDIGVGRAVYVSTARAEVFKSIIPAAPILAATPEGVEELSSLSINVRAPP